MAIKGIRWKYRDYRDTGGTWQSFAGNLKVMHKQSEALSERFSILWRNQTHHYLSNRLTKTHSETHTPITQTLKFPTHKLDAVLETFPFDHIIIIVIIMIILSIPNEFYKDLLCWRRCSCCAGSPAPPDGTWRSPPAAWSPPGFRLGSACSCQLNWKIIF